MADGRLGQSERFGSLIDYVIDDLTDGATASALPLRSDSLALAPALHESEEWPTLALANSSGSGR